MQCSHIYSAAISHTPILLDCVMFSTALQAGTCMFWEILRVGQVCGVCHKGHNFLCAFNMSRVVGWLPTDRFREAVQDAQATLVKTFTNAFESTFSTLFLSDRKWEHELLMSSIELDEKLAAGFVHPLSSEWELTAAVYVAKSWWSNHHHQSARSNFHCLLQHIPRQRNCKHATSSSLRLCPQKRNCLMDLKWAKRWEEYWKQHLTWATSQWSK